MNNRLNVNIAARFRENIAVRNSLPVLHGTNTAPYFRCAKPVGWVIFPEGLQLVGAGFRNCLRIPERAPNVARPNVGAGFIPPDQRLCSMRRL
jgi:hypothetical protein